MRSNIADELRLAKAKAQYDEYAKRILSNRLVLAWILKNTTEEFCDIPLEQIAGECIGDDVEISKVRVRPGETNVSDDADERPGRVLGDITEDKVPGEGAVFYDIRVSAYAPDYIENAISKYSMRKEDILKGIPDIKKDYDKLGVVVVCLNRKRYYDESTGGLTGFLNTLLATDMDSRQAQ